MINVLNKLIIKCLFKNKKLKINFIDKSEKNKRGKVKYFSDSNYKFIMIFKNNFLFKILKI